MFDSSKCLIKAEKKPFWFLLRREQKKKKKFSDQFQIPREDPSSLPRSYPQVFPSKYPTSETSVVHVYTVRILSASPRGAGWRRTRTAAAPSRWSRRPGARVPAPGAPGAPGALGGGQVLLRAALLREHWRAECRRGTFSLC